MINSIPEQYYRLKTDRLSFRKLTRDDIDKWKPFFFDNPTLKFLGALMMSDLTEEEKATKWIESQIDRQENSKYGQLAVLDADTDEFLGVGGIISREMNGDMEYEVSYSICRPHQGKGYATELAICFKKYAEKYIATPSVISIIHIDNEASMNVARKNGMEITDTTTFMEMPVHIFRVNLSE